MNIIEALQKQEMATSIQRYKTDDVYQYIVELDDKRVVPTAQHQFFCTSLQEALTEINSTVKLSKYYFSLSDPIFMLFDIVKQDIDLIINGWCCDNSTMLEYLIVHEGILSLDHLRTIYRAKKSVELRMLIQDEDGNTEVGETWIDAEVTNVYDRLKHKIDNELSYHG